MSADVETVRMRLRRVPPRRYEVVFYIPDIGPLLTPGTALPPGGAETQIHLLARAMAERGMRVAVVVYERPGDRLPAAVDGVDVIARPLWRGNRRLRGKVAEMLAIWRAVGHSNPEVVVQRTAGVTTGLVAMATRMHGCRFAYSSANIVDFEYQRLETRRRNIALFRLGVRLAETLIVQTPEQEELAKRRFGRRAVVINSIAERTDRRCARPEAFLWIGRLTHYKQPLAFVELARAVPEARFWMVGVPYGDEGMELAAKVAEAARGLRNLEVLDPRPRGELMELVERSLAIVNTADYEGMPNIFLEGWARGVPALALTHDPDGVIVREGLGDFAAGSRARLAELARSMWASRHDRDELAHRCVRYVQREHGVEAIVGRWLNALGLAS